MTIILRFWPQFFVGIAFRRRDTQFNDIWYNDIQYDDHLHKNKRTQHSVQQYSASSIAIMLIIIVELFC